MSQSLCEIVCGLSVLQYMCVPVCRMRVLWSWFLVLVSVVVKLVYMQTIPQLLLVWIAFILYRLEGPTHTSIPEYTPKQQEKNMDLAASLLLQTHFFLTVRPLSTSISVSFSAMFSKSLMTDRAVSWWIVSSQDPVLVGRVAELSVSHRRDRSTRTSQDTALPPSMPWMTERHSAPEAWNSPGGAAENRHSGSVKVSQSSGEAGNRRPSG